MSNPRPKSLAELLSQAQVSTKGKPFGFRPWLRSAGLLMDQGLTDAAGGHWDDAYVSLLKAVSIALEVAPTHKDFALSDPIYKELRKRAEDCLDTLEKVKGEITARSEAWERQQQDTTTSLAIVAGTPSIPARTSSSLQSLMAAAEAKYRQEPGPTSATNSIQPANLLNILSQTNLLVLVLDVRPMQEYSQGHILWPSLLVDDANKKKHQGIIQIEPQWLALPSTTAQDLESYILAFNPDTLLSRELFASRHKMDLVVLVDNGSHKQGSPSPLGKLLDILKSDKSLKQPPVLVQGGFTAWKDFVMSRNASSSSSWIGHGFRRTPSLNRPSKDSKDIPPADYARTSYEYINHRLGKTSLAAFPTKGAADSNTPAPPHRKTSHSIASASERFPEIEAFDGPTSPPITRRTSRFDDPFFAFSKESPTFQPLSYPQVSASLEDQYRRLQQVAPPDFTYPLLPKPVRPLEKVRPPPPSASIRPAPVADILVTSSQYGPPNASITSSQYARPTPSPPFVPPPPQNRPPVTLSSAPLLPLPNTPPPLQMPLMAKGASSSTGDFRMDNGPPPSRQPGIPPPPLHKPPSTPVAVTRPQLGKPDRPSLPPPPSFRLTSTTSSQKLYETTTSPPVPPPVPPKPRLSRTGSQPALSTDTLAISQLSTTSIGVAGLKNLGNTCYLNSIVQCLSATMPLARYFLDGSYRKHINRSNPMGTKGVVAETYSSLIKSMWSETEMIVNPSKFKEMVGKYSPSFQGNEQHDSQEFLAFLLDALHEDLNLARRGNMKPEAVKDEDSDTIPDGILLEKEWLRYRKMNWSIVVDLFQGMLRSQLKCLTCGKISTTFNPFMYLTVPIPESNRSGQKGGPVYLQECIEKFIEEEILDGEDAWHCPRCKVPRRAVKRLTIAKLPIILLIHVKRFYFKGPFRDKIETYVEFPASAFDLSRYLHAPKSPQQREEPPPVYDLYAVSNHFGGLNGGHYTAQVKNGYKQHWLNFDDSRVTVCQDKLIKSKAAYILFYVQEGASPSTNWWGGGFEASKM